MDDVSEWCQIRQLHDPTLCGSNRGPLYQKNKKGLFQPFSNTSGKRPLSVQTRPRPSSRAKKLPFCGKFGVLLWRLGLGYYARDVDIKEV